MSRKRATKKSRMHLYTRAEILKRKVFYWIRNDYEIFDYLREYKHILRPITEGSGYSRRYYFHQRDIEKFIQMYERGELTKILKTGLRTGDSLGLSLALKSDNPKRPQGYLNALDIYKSGAIYWVNSYFSVRRYMTYQKYKHIMQPLIRFEGKNRERRIYVHKDNLKKFLELFEANELIT